MLFKKDKESIAVVSNFKGYFWTPFFKSRVSGLVLMMKFGFYPEKESFMWVKGTVVLS